MIVQSPELEVSEPKETYIGQGMEVIAGVMEDIVGETNVQLCPRVIEPAEEYFKEDNQAIVYGTIISEPNDGNKSILYSRDFRRYKSYGVGTDSCDEAKHFAREVFDQGNRVRLKDSRASNGRSQHVVENMRDMIDAFHDINEDSNFRVVVMPNLETVEQRISVGRINLGKFGVYNYVAREEITQDSGIQVYEGAQIGLYHEGNDAAKNLAVAELKTSYLAHMGFTMLDIYRTFAYAKRASVDVISGTTQNGKIFADVVDITPRIGVITPAELLAIREIKANESAVCFAGVKLLYKPKAIPLTGVNFVDTDELVVNAQINSVLEEK